MYSVLSFGRMAADGVRMDAYARAIAAAVEPGSVVIDVGAGSGIFSLLAARAGARVHAIDMNPAIWLLRDLAVENGLADRITIHHASSLETELEEKADVVVADLRGSTPLYDGNLEALRDARTRLLAPGGTLIPKSDMLFVGLVEQDVFWRNLELGWTGFERRGFTTKAARNAVLNAVYDDDGRPVAANQLLSDGKAWAELRYGEDYQPVVEGTVELTARRGGTAHGLALWFEATVADGIAYSSAPGNVSVYNRMLLPLLEPVSLDFGDIARVTVRVDVRGERWAWDTEVLQSGGAPRRRFRQANFLGKPTSPEALLRESSTYTPRPSPRGERAKKALGLMDGNRTVQEIADALGGTPAMLDEVREYVRQYGR